MRLRLLALLPSLLFALLAAGMLLRPDLVPTATAATGPLLLAAGCAAVLLGWRFHRGSAALLAVLVLMAGDVLTGGALFPIGAPAGLGAAVAVLLPLVFVVLAALPERRWSSPLGLLRMLLLPALAAGGVVLATPPWDEARAAFDVELLPGTTPSWWSLPDAAVLSWSVGALALGVLVWRDGSPLVRMLPAVLLALLTAALAGPETAWAHVGLAGLALLVGVLEQAHSLAYRDELTGLGGRRALMELLRRVGPRYTVAMLDVDHFKKFNDTWGHDVGDIVLRRVAACMAGVTGGGRPFRYGGEEFTVVFPGRTAEEATPHLEALRRAVGEARITVTPKTKRGKPRKPKDLSVTISIGVAEREADTAHPLQVIKRADEALYRAKEGGRNRVST